MHARSEPFRGVHARIADWLENSRVSLKKGSMKSIVGMIAFVSKKTGLGNISAAPIIANKVKSAKITADDEVDGCDEDEV